APAQTPPVAAPAAPAVAEARPSATLAFEANIGQFRGNTAFVAHSGGTTARLAAPAADFPPSGSGPTVPMQLVGGNANAPALGTHRQPGVVNYLSGPDPSSWVTGAPLFGNATFRGVYSGIDLVYHGNAVGSLEFDFVVAPGANPGAIALNFAGAESVTL